MAWKSEPLPKEMREGFERAANHDRGVLQKGNRPTEARRNPNEKEEERDESRA